MKPLLLGAALVVATLSCDSGPKAGELVFDLTTPNQNDGAVQFTVTATDPATLVNVTAACAGCQVFSTAVSDAEIRGVLTGTVVAGAALRVTVSDVKTIDLYTAHVVAAATRTYELQLTTGYALTAR